MIILSRIYFKNALFIPGRSKRVDVYEPAARENADVVVVIKDDVVLFMLPQQETASVSAHIKDEAAALKLDPKLLHHVVEVPRADCTFHWLMLSEAADAYAKNGLIQQRFPHPATHTPPPAPPAPSTPKPAATAPAVTRRRDPNIPPGYKQPQPPPPSRIIEEDLLPPPPAE